MEMAFELLANFWRSIITLIDSYVFTIGGFQVTWLSIIFAFLVISMVVGFFWKGARA